MLEMLKVLLSKKKMHFYQTFSLQKKGGENSKVAACLNEFKRGNCKVR